MKRVTQNNNYLYLQYYSRGMQNLDEEYIFLTNYYLLYFLLEWQSLYISKSFWKPVLNEFNLLLNIYATNFEINLSLMN